MHEFEIPAGGLSKNTKMANILMKTKRFRIQKKCWLVN